MTADFLFCFILFLCFCNSLVKQSKFGDATTGLPDKWRLRNERRNSLLLTRLGSASSRAPWEIWFNQSEALPKSGVMSRHQYGISAFVSQTSFGGETPNIGCFLRIFFFMDSQESWETSTTTKCRSNEEKCAPFPEWKEKRHGDNSPL